MASCETIGTFHSCCCCCCCDASGAVVHSNFVSSQALERARTNVLEPREKRPSWMTGALVRLSSVQRSVFESYRSSSSQSCCTRLRHVVHTRAHASLFLSGRLTRMRTANSLTSKMSDRLTGVDVGCRSTIARPRQRTSSDVITLCAARSSSAPPCAVAPCASPSRSMEPSAAITNCIAVRSERSVTPSPSAAPPTSAARARFLPPMLNIG
mmetsp:Transcript_21185/g.65750  ORF Transcript_21185/g.65750 Transcript_21185/m.65750 type:complete len:211 (-) Transcript_21185:19-651(-)